jgi:hypothetical protein
MTDEELHAARTTLHATEYDQLARWCRAMLVFFDAGYLELADELAKGPADAEELFVAMSNIRRLARAGAPEA